VCERECVCVFAWVYVCVSVFHHNALDQSGLNRCGVFVIVCEKVCEFVSVCVRVCVHVCVSGCECECECGWGWGLGVVWVCMYMCQSSTIKPWIQQASIGVVLCCNRVSVRVGVYESESVCLCLCVCACVYLDVCVCVGRAFATRP